MPPRTQTPEAQHGARSGGSLRDRPPLRAARALAGWAAVAVLGFSAACASLQVNAPSFASARYATTPAMGASVGDSPAQTAPASHHPSSLYAPNIAIGDSVLQAAVVRLRRRSPSFDSAIVAIEQSGIPVVIGTEKQLRDQLPPGYRYVGGWQALTAVYPLTDNGARGRPIEHVAVVVRISELHAALAHDTSSADTTLFNRFVERVVAHEIYGHLMPQLALGKTAPIACDDPTSAADWYTACVMRRERHVMAQLAQSRGTYAILGTH